MAKCPLQSALTSAASTLLRKQPAVNAARWVGLWNEIASIVLC